MKPVEPNRTPTSQKALQRLRQLTSVCVFVTALLVTLAPFADAVVLSSLRGVVHDPDHRAVADARVTVKSVSSDFAQTLTTGPDGTFETATVPIGEYQVTV